MSSTGQILSSPPAVPRRVRITGHVFLVLGLLMAAAGVLTFLGSFGIEVVIHKMREIEARKPGGASPGMNEVLRIAAWFPLFRVLTVVQAIAGIFLFRESRGFLRLRRRSRTVLEIFAWLFAAWSVISAVLVYALLPRDMPDAPPLWAIISAGTLPYLLLSLWAVRVLRSEEVRQAITL